MRNLTVDDVLRYYSSRARSVRRYREKIATDDALASVVVLRALTVRPHSRRDLIHRTNLVRAARLDAVVGLLVAARLVESYPYRRPAPGPNQGRLGTYYKLTPLGEDYMTTPAVQLLERRLERTRKNRPEKLTSDPAAARAYVLGWIGTPGPWKQWRGAMDARTEAATLRARDELIANGAIQILIDGATTWVRIPNPTSAVARHRLKIATDDAAARRLVLGWFDLDWTPRRLLSHRGVRAPRLEEVLAALEAEGLITKRNAGTSKRPLFAYRLVVKKSGGTS